MILSFSLELEGSRCGGYGDALDTRGQLQG